MLWYKSWMETRFQFLIGLALLICAAAGLVLTRSEVVKLMQLVPALKVNGEIGRQIRESVELARDYRGYVWSQWFGKNLTQLGTIFAVVLGVGGLLPRGSGTLFTLSLPASRNRLLGVRAAAGLAELFVVVFVPSLLIPLLSPAIGETYGVGNALIHSACLFIADAVFFSLAFLFSTMFDDLWRPLLLALAAAGALRLFEMALRDVAPYSIFRVMSAELYFRTGELPWLGLLACAIASGALLYGAAINMARQDF